MSEATGITFTTPDGITLCGSVFEPSGPASHTVLMLHGAGQTRHSWKRAGHELSGAGIRVFTVDTRGHGDSDWSPTGDYSFESLTADVVAVIDAIGSPVIVVGASMGGLTGMAAAHRSGPDRVTALALVDVVPYFEKQGSARIREFMMGGIDGFETLDDAADAIAAYLPHRQRPASTAGLRKNLRRGDDGRWYWHWDPRFLTNRGGSGVPASGLMSAAKGLTVPIVVVRGRLSDVVSAEGVARFRTEVPTAALIELGGAGHTAAGDDNDAFTSAIIDFTSRVRNG